MVAKINIGNSLYGALSYNGQKVNEGEGKLLVTHKIFDAGDGKLDIARCMEDFKRYMPEQVQDFYPTPSTISTCMYYTGYDCRTMEKVYVPVNPHEKAMQRALIQYRNPKNYDLVAEALKIAGRTDLIGFDKKCLIKPRNFDKSAHDEKEFRGHGGVSGGKNAVGRNENSRNGNNRNTAGKNTGGRNTGASGRNMEKLSGSKMNAAKTAGKKKGIRNVHKKKGN